MDDPLTSTLNDATPEKKKRKRYTILDKLSKLRAIKRQLDEGFSVRDACNEVGLTTSMYVRWKQQMSKMRERRNNKAKSLAVGRVSCLKPIENALLKFIFELREQAIAINIHMVARRAAALSRSFKEKSRSAR